MRTPRLLPRSQRLAWSLAGAVLLVAIVLVLAVLSALRAASALEAAQDGLEAARSAEDGEVERALEAARADVASAEDALRSPPARTVAAVPLLGRSWRAEAAVARAAASTLAAVSAASSAAPSLQAQDGLDGLAVRRLADALAEPVRRAERDVELLRETSTSWTPGTVARGVRRASTALTGAVDGLVRGRAAADLLGGLTAADRPRRLLVALQNNAELRGTGGYVSTYATGSLVDGTVQLSPFVDVEDVSEPPDRARPVPAPATFRRDYGPFLADTTLFKNWNMTPDVPTAAAVVAEVAGSLLGERPDVVLLLDVPAMSGLVGLSGQTVRLPNGDEVSADDLPDALLVDSYVLAGTGLTDQAQRRAALRAAAGEAVRRVLAAEVDPLRAAQVLAGLARERHLAVWAAQEDDQALVREAGLDGAVEAGPDEDLVMISTNNLAANKLDVHARRSVDLEVVLDADRATVTQRLELQNAAPEGLDPYVAGRDRPGLLRERVEFSLSPRASVQAVTVAGAEAAADVRDAERRTAVVTYVEVPAGQAVTVEVRYVVPVEDGRYAVRLLPQPLAEDALLALRLYPGDQQELAAVDGARLSSGLVEQDGPWSEVRRVEVRLERTSVLARAQRAVARWWTSPVRG